MNQNQQPNKNRRPTPQRHSGQVPDGDGRHDAYRHHPRKSRKQRQNPAAGGETVATTTTQRGEQQEQRVVTQEVKTTATVTSGDQFARRDSISSTSSGDSGTPIDGPYGEEDDSTVIYNKSYTGVDDVAGASKIPSGPNVEHHRVLLDDSQEGVTAEGEIVSSQTVSSKTRTVETITYKTERDGVVETRVEQKITIQSDGDPIDHDKALAEAIQEATAMNPDMTVEKIEIQQQTQ
ncbi:protein 4.1 homolog [Aedes aegypti]|uniref:Band 4.1 C-terminal domain-containing protein n=1 Tax=Aedes aegypti TaxID=7159 RepID=A0A903VGJ6_AEDAE|nr:protein 4.1 homolog [Aedes aegypti]